LNVDCDYWQVALLAPAPASDAVQVRVPVHVRLAIGPVPQQGSPPAPQGSQVDVPPPPPVVRHTSNALEHVPPAPPQQASPEAPQAVQVPVLLLPAPVHSVPEAVQVLLLAVLPQHA
jgi:hypothetical protein